MSQDHDKQFFNTFAIVIGILVLIAIIILWLSNVVARQNVDSRTNQYAQDLVVERIKPVGEAAVEGAASGDGGGGETAVAANGADAGGDDLGKSTYDSACFACHGTGAAGAPMVGDAADWNARSEQGRETLVKHAIEGYQGEKGFMPPKGGQTQLSDDAVIAALDYMLENSQ